MNSKTTRLLAATVLIIFAIIGIGFMTATPPQSSQPTTTRHTVKSDPPLSNNALAERLVTEQPAIHVAISSAFPSLGSLYTIEREKLYQKGEWYGAILQYKGGDVNNRDTLRIVLNKKDGVWTVKTTPPTLLVNNHDIPDAPNTLLDDLNQPAVLVGAGDSPTLTPGE